MALVLIVKGDKHVLRHHQEDADRLYGFMDRYVLEKGHAARGVDPRQLVSLDQVEYVLAHSRGTNAVLDHLQETIPPNVEGIALFDPSPQYAEAWNRLQVPKVAFISTILGRPYAEGFDSSVHLQDGHYFTNSFPRIERKLDELFE